MGYYTDFNGSIKITPTLPIHVINIINALARGRNNFYGDADSYSFDSVIHHLRGEPNTRGQTDRFGFPIRLSYLDFEKI